MDNQPYKIPRLAYVRHVFRTAEISCHPVYLFLGFAVALAVGHFIGDVSLAECVR